jgi:hypothetical protein
MGVLELFNMNSTVPMYGNAFHTKTVHLDLLMNLRHDAWGHGDVF